MEKLETDYRSELSLLGYEFHNKELISFLGEKNIVQFYKSFLPDTTQNVSIDSIKVLLYRDRTLIINFLKFLDDNFYKFYSDRNKDLTDEQVKELLFKIFDVFFIDSRKGYDVEAINRDSLSVYFKNRYKDYYLPYDTPLYLQDKYYSGRLTYEDVKNNEQYLKNVNISAGYRAIFQNGITINNPAFLLILKRCNGNIEEFHTSIVYHYLRKKHFDNIPCLSFGDINELIEDDYKKATTEFALFKYSNLKILKQFNFISDQIEMIERNMARLNISTRFCSLDIDIRLFDDLVVNNFDGFVIDTAIYYSNTLIDELLFSYSKNPIIVKQLTNWFEYLQKNNIYNAKYIAYSILNYSKYMELFNGLCRDETSLSTTQKELLLRVISDDSHPVNKQEQFLNYFEYKMELLKEKLFCDDLIAVKNAICELLFDCSYSVISYSPLLNKEYRKLGFVNSGVITEDTERLFIFLNDLCDFNGSTLELRKHFSEFLSKYNISESIAYEELTRQIYTRLLNKELYSIDYDSDKKNIDYTFGVDSKECQYDIYGKSITKNDTIPILNFDGQPFKLVIHGISLKSSPDRSVSGLSKSLLENPSLWNQVNGVTTISTSLISDMNLCLQYGDVVYGFFEIPDGVMHGMYHSDAGTIHGRGILNPTMAFGENCFVTPSKLAATTGGIYSYNEIAIDRKVSGETNKFGGRISPTCIVCLNEPSKCDLLAAQYFRIPIYKINAKKYRQRNDELVKKYSSMDIMNFSKIDIDYIFGLSELVFNDNGIKINLNGRIDLCLALCEKALNENIITIEQYNEYIDYIYYSVVANYDRIDARKISEELEKRKYNSDYGPISPKM